MAREAGIYRRGDSPFWWIDVALPNGRRVRQSTGTGDRKEAEAFVVKLKHDAHREAFFGVKPKRTWQEAVIRYLAVKSSLRGVEKQRQICRKLDPFLGRLTLDRINGDVIWSFCQAELKRGRKPATINRCLALIRSLLRMAQYEWQWIDSMPKVRLLPGEVERDRWLTKEEADRLIARCAPHLAAMARFALATGCRAREIAGLEWRRVDLQRRTAWLDETKNGTPRGVPLNRDAVLAGGAEGKAFPLLLHLSRQARAMGIDEHRLGERDAQGRTDERAVPRSAPHVGLVASAVRHELRRAEGTGRLEIPFDGRPLRKVCYGES